MPVLDSPCPGEQSARDSVASPRVLNHSSLPAAAENLTSRTASVPADTTHTNCPPIMRTLPPSQGEQASTRLSRSGRPASATALAAASIAASSLLQQPSRTFSGTLSKFKAAMPVVNSKVGQHTEHDSLLPQNALLQPPSNSTDIAAGPPDGHLSQAVQRQASQLSFTGSQPELGQATMSRSTLRRPSKLMLPSEPNSQEGSLSPATSRKSPKPTLLRDQHLPGELLHQKSAFPSDIFMRHEAACASPTASQPDSPPVSAWPSSPSSPLQHRQSIAEAQIGQSEGSTLRHKSPKGTLLRDQHLPGEVLHQKTAFPSDIHMRHEEACTPGLAKQPAISTKPVLEAKQQSSTAVMPQQKQQTQQVVDAEMLINTTSGVNKQSTLPRAVSFAAALMEAEVDGAWWTPGTGLHADSKALTNRPSKTRGNSTLPSPGGKEVAPDLLQSTDKNAMQAAVPLNLYKTGSRDAGPQPKSSLKRGDSRLQQSSQQPSQQFNQRSSLKKADNGLQHSSEMAPATLRSVAGPCFEATHNDLPRSRTWAREWLEMGTQDVDHTNPDFEQLQQQQQRSLRESNYQSPLLRQQATQQHAVHQSIQQQLEQQQHGQQNTSQEQPKDQTLWQRTASELLLPSPGATARSHQHLSLPPGAPGADPDNTHAMLQHTSNGQLIQRQGRPQTAPEGFWSVEADAPWALDARRLHSARPGSGGSPTARYTTIS